VEQRFVYSGEVLADTFIRENPFAFVLGAIAHRQSEPKTGWLLPFRLRNRLDHLYPSKMVRMRRDDLVDAIKREPALHPMPGLMANRFLKAADQIQVQYLNRAERIWNDTHSGNTILLRLRCIAGIDPIKAEMMLAILVRDNVVFLDS
jgi:hypothetical protein